MRLSHPDCNRDGHGHANGDCDCDCNGYTHSDCNTYGDTDGNCNANGDSYANTDGASSHTYTNRHCHRDCYGNADRDRYCHSNSDGDGHGYSNCDRDGHPDGDTWMYTGKLRRHWSGTNSGWRQRNAAGLWRTAYDQLRGVRQNCAANECVGGCNPDSLVGRRRRHDPDLTWRHSEPDHGKPDWSDFGQLDWGQLQLQRDV